MISNLGTRARSPKGLALIALGLWSTQAILLSTGLNKNEISLILFPSFIFAAIFIVVFRIYHTQLKTFTALKSNFPRKPITLVIGSILMLAYHTLLFAGLKIGPEIETNLMNFLWPLLLIIFSKRIFRDEKLFNWLRSKLGNGSFSDFADVQESKENNIFKIILALAGITLMITHGNRLDFIHWQGPLIGLSAAFCWALLSVLLRFQNTSNYISLFIVSTALLSGIVWWIEGHPGLFNIKLLTISLFLGVGPFGIAMLCWEHAMKRGCASEIATLGFLAPFFSTVLLFVFRAESISRWSFIGFGLVILAIIRIDAWLSIQRFLARHPQRISNALYHIIDIIKIPYTPLDPHHKTR
ncbi:DMT family transporter [candidate division KSB1 bacterium]|nr:DMT family transporter [candidate division KSB1 bacterium]